MRCTINQIGLISAATIALLISITANVAALAKVHDYSDTRMSRQLLTLHALRNGSYEIPDLTCGYKEIRLHDGHGTRDGIKVEFGRSAFGKLNGTRNSALVHLAYRDESLGWLQVIVVIQQHKNKLLQVAEYRLADSEEVQHLDFVNGEATVNSVVNSARSMKLAGNLSIQKVTKLRVCSESSGCSITATEWQKDSASGKLKPFVDMRAATFAAFQPEDQLCQTKR